MMHVLIGLMLLPVALFSSQLTRTDQTDVVVLNTGESTTTVPLMTIRANSAITLNALTVDLGDTSVDVVTLACDGEQTLQDDDPNGYVSFSPNILLNENDTCEIRYTIQNDAIDWSIDPSVYASISEYAYTDSGGTDSGSLGGVTVQLAGVVVEDVENLLAEGNAFENTQLSPGLTDVPFFQFDLRAVNASATLNTLVISGKSVNGTSLRLYQTDGETYSTDSVLATSNIQSGQASFDVGDISINEDETLGFFLVADFGDSMDDSAEVSVNVSAETSVTVDDDSTYTVDDDSTYVVVKDYLAAPYTMIDPDVQVGSDVEYASSVFTGCNGGVCRLVSGMYMVPMLVATLNVSNATDDFSLTFKASGINFQDNEGISRVSVVLDANTRGQLDEGDTLLGSTTVTDSVKTITVSNMALVSGQKQIVVYIDLGQNVPSSDISIQLTDASDGVSGVFPTPVTSKYVQTTPHLVCVTQINNADVSKITNEMDSFEVIIRRLLYYSEDISIERVTPKFYAGDSFGGADRTYEYTIEEDHEDDSTFFVDPSNVLTEGHVKIDANIWYTIGGDLAKIYYPSAGILLTRARDQTGEYQSVVRTAYVGDNTSQSTMGTDVEVSTNHSEYSWTLPGIVETIQNGDAEFHNYQSVPTNSTFKVTFRDEGQDIDWASISVTMDGDMVSHEYDTTEGLLVIKANISGSGQINIDVTDLVGNAYPTIPIIFYASDDMQVNQFLVHPNPYSPSASNLDVTFGFSLTQDATVSIYVYDASGRIFGMIPAEAHGSGYHKKVWDGVEEASGQYLPSGTYFIRLVAEDTEGNTQIKTIKWAVY